MKKYLGILLVMIGIVLIPRNVNALGTLSWLTGQEGYECETVTNTDKKVTTCDIVYQNTGDVDFNGGTLELTFTPTNENTTFEFSNNSEYATSVGSNETSELLDVKSIASGETAVLGTVTWTADASLEDSEAGGTISPSWQDIISNPSTDVDDGVVTITDDYGSSSSDMLVNSYTQEKTYNVTITWGSMEYDYVEKLDGTSEWTAIRDTDGMAQGYVLVENYSNVAMNAYIKFESSIEGVEANYTTDYSYYENDEEHVVSSNLDYLALDAYVENENNYHASVQWIVNLTGGTYDAVEEAYNNGERKIGTVTILVGDASMGDVG